jgi:protein-L-isoaspartate(D-aspartate) O-methyltransferase
MTMNFDEARHNMVEQQVRPWEVLDARVLELFGSIQREDFVPVRYRKLAFADLSIPLDHGEFMMKPVVEGRMLQAADISPEETVLEVGIHESFTEDARRRLAEQGIDNVDLHTGDVMSGWQPEQAQDVVVVTGSVPVIPEIFQGWVNPGGRLFCITGQSPAMEAVLMTRLNATEWRRESLFETDLPPLVNSVKAAEFEF